MSEDKQQFIWRIKRFFLHFAFLIGPFIISKTFDKNISFCLFKFLFKIDCPACGITRSVIALYKGSIKNSLYCHPAGIIIVFLSFMICLYFLLVIIGKIKINWLVESKSYKITGTIMIISLFVGSLLKHIGE